MAVQEGPTSIRVSWSPPTPLGDTTGYRIYFSGGRSGSEDVNDGSTDNYALTGLENGETYKIFIVGTSEHLPSYRIVPVETTLRSGICTVHATVLCHNTLIMQLDTIVGLVTLDVF